MNKKFISIALAGVMALSCAAVSASAADVEVEASKESGKIQFDLGEWNHDDAGNIAFYIWDETAGEFASPDGWSTENAWGSKKLRGEDLGDGIAESYEIDLSGREDHNVFVIFHDRATGNQTYDCVVTPAALGKKAYMTGNTLENPVDSEKVCIEAAFEGIENECGSYRKVTSTGNIVGNCSAPADNPAKIVAKYVFDMYGVTDKSGVECCTEEKVANAISQFGTDADSVWAEFQNFSGEDGYADKEAGAKALIKPTSAGGDATDTDTASDTDTSSDNGSGSNNSGSNNSGSNNSGSSNSSSGTKTTTTTTATPAASTATTGTTEAATATGDTTGTAAFATVLVIAAAAMFLARKKVED